MSTCLVGTPAHTKILRDSIGPTIDNFLKEFYKKYPKEKVKLRYSYEVQQWKKI